MLRALVPDLLHPVDRLAEFAYPVVFVLADETNAPGQRLAAAPGDAGIDQRVEYPTFVETEAGHRRGVDGREVNLVVSARDAPTHRAPEGQLGVVGDRHSLLARGLAERDDLLLGAQARAGRTEVPRHEDLVGVVLHDRRVGEPAVG